LSQTAIYGILALGMTFVITSQGIDLSVGSVLALAGCVAASFAQVSGASQKYFPNMGQMPLIVPILLACLWAAFRGIKRLADCGNKNSAVHCNTRYVHGCTRTCLGIHRRNSDQQSASRL
ncbi:ABC transporter permease subunit, partial [Treponema phagedenis]